MRGKESRRLHIPRPPFDPDAPVISSGMPMIIGNWPFVGSLDEISVWARGLSATEVSELAK
jgi:hypothetical protein